MRSTDARARGPWLDHEIAEDLANEALEANRATLYEDEDGEQILAVPDVIAIEDAAQKRPSFPCEPPSLKLKRGDGRTVSFYWWLPEAGDAR